MFVHEATGLYINQSRCKLNSMVELGSLTFIGRREVKLGLFHSVPDNKRPRLLLVLSFLYSKVKEKKKNRGREGQLIYKER